jgi:hypothetical protein
MDNDDIFAVEDTSTSQPAAETTPAQAAPASTQQTEAIQTDLTPNEEQQGILERIRDASQHKSFKIENGRVVLTGTEGAPNNAPARTTVQTAPAQQTAQQATQTQPDEPMVELTWRGQVVQKPLSEVRNLAQKGFDYEVKNSEMNQQRQTLAQREEQLNQMFQSVQAILPQQTAQTPANKAVDTKSLTTAAMNAVKEAFGKEDPDFEYDPLSPEQATVYNMALYDGIRVKSEQDQADAAVKRQEQERELRLSGWEAQQKAADPLYEETAQWAFESVGKDHMGRDIPRIHQILNGVQLKAFESAVASGDTATLSRVATFCKAKYQQQKLGITTKPQTVAVPVVQPPGTGRQTPSETPGQKPWPKTEHNLPQEERIALLKQRFNRGRG